MKNLTVPRPLVADGVLDYGSGDVKGRQAIKTVIAGMPKPKEVPRKRAGAARHNITKRKIYNEGRDEWAYKSGKNPAW